MANLTIQKNVLAGLKPTYAAATAGGDTFPNNGNTVLHIKNGDAAPKTITINSERPCNFGFDHDVSVTIPAGEDRIIGPFPTNRFGANTGITYDAVAALTIAAISNV